MNTGLKAIVDSLVAVEGTVVDAVGKKDLTSVLVPDLIKVGLGLPAVISNFADLKSEIAGLATPANLQDLEAYVVGKIAGGSAKASAIITAAVNLVLAGEQLYVAIKM